jgi:putative transposase
VRPTPDLLAQHGLVPSMSRKGNCWDNAVTERFFLNLKMERVWQRQYANHGEAVERRIADYIVNFYNPHATAFDPGLPVSLMHF